MSEHGTGHGHDSGHGSGHEDAHGHEGHDAGHATATVSIADNWFSGIQGYFTSSMPKFASGVFLLVTLGMLYTVLATNYYFGEWTLLVPPLLALIAYYNRTVAVIGIIGLILAMLI